MTPVKDDDFRRRVRAARSYAGLSQAGLAGAIGRLYPADAVSPSTIKRLEQGDPAVGGSQREWTVWVADATGVPEWFLEDGWPDGNIPAELRGAPARLSVALERADFVAEFVSDDQRREEVNQIAAEIQAGISRLEQRLLDAASHEWAVKRERAAIRDRGALESANQMLATIARLSDEELEPSERDVLQRVAIRLAHQGDLPVPAGEMLPSLRAAYEVLHTDGVRGDGEDAAGGSSEGSKSKPRSAVDAPPPAPPGELGRRAADAPTSTGDREQSPSPAGQDGHEATGG